MSGFYVSKNLRTLQLGSALLRCAEILLVLETIPSGCASYIGLSVSGHVVKPTLKWSNVLYAWIQEQNIRADVAKGDMNVNFGNILLPEELRDSQFSNVCPEVNLYDETKVVWGGAIWCGFGRMAISRFYYGAEICFNYKHLKIATEYNKKNIKDIEKYTYFHRHILSGQVCYNSKIQYKKYFEGDLNFRLGYCPSERFVGTVLLGAGVHANKFDQVFATTNPSTLTFIRANDDTTAGNWKQDFFYFRDHDSDGIGDFPKDPYEVKVGTYYYVSLNLGAGFDYFVTPRTFLRCDYQYKISFSRTLRSPTDASPEADYCALYSLRYQDCEHCLSFGLGWRFS